jgi:hypothetical protein
MTEEEKEEKDKVLPYHTGEQDLFILDEEDMDEEEADDDFD